MDRRLYKSKNDKLILGVCGGVGNYLGVDSSIVRIVWAVSSFLYGSGIFLYIIAAFILPDDENEVSQQNEPTDSLKKYANNKVIAIILILSGVFLLLRNLTVFFDTRYFWPSLLIVLGVLLIAKRKGKDDNEE